MAIGSQKNIRNLENPFFHLAISTLSVYTIETRYTRETRMKNYDVKIRRKDMVNGYNVQVGTEMVYVSADNKEKAASEALDEIYTHYIRKGWSYDFDVIWCRKSA